MQNAEVSEPAHKPCRKDLYIGPRQAAALSAVSLRVTAGEFVALVGPSGCGKSTLLRLVAGLLTPDQGEITFPGRSLPPKRRFVFQIMHSFPG
ncbi:MAG: ATP-binding cassette domain-containing protein [Caldilineaceae bacterium]